MNIYLLADAKIENNETIKSLIISVDKEAKFISATTTTEVETLIRSQHPKIIILSNSLSGKSVTELCKTLKSGLPGVFKVALTSNEKIHQKETDEILNSEADAFFVFPIDELSFKIQIKTWIKPGKFQNKNESQAEKPEQIKPVTEERFKSVVENLTDGILIIEENGRITEANQSIEKITGYDIQSCIGMFAWDFMYQMSLPSEHNEPRYTLLKDNLEQILSERQSDRFGIFTEHRIRQKNGQSRYIESTVYPIHSNGSFVIASVMRDITQRKLFEQAIKNSESKYHAIFDANKDGVSIFFINPDNSLGHFVEANKAAYEMIGYPKEEFLKMNILDIEFSTPKKSIAKQIFNLNKKNFASIETKLRHKSGKSLNVDINIVPIKYNNQDAIMLIVRDTTEREKAESDLKASENLYRNLVERMPDGVYKSSHSGKFIEVNPAMVKMLGYDSKKELLSIDIKNDLYFHPKDRESIALQEQNEELGIFRIKKKDGSEIWVEDHGWYILNDKGEIIFHEGIMRDISERKVADEMLKESEERFKMLFEKAPIGYQSLDENGLLIDVNETWLEIMGYKKEEVIGSCFCNFLTTEYAENYKKQFSAFKITGVVQTEFELIRKDDKIIRVQLKGRIGHTSTGKFKQTHCVISDITELHLATKAIADERILLRTLIDNIPDMVYVKDTAGRKIISNKADLAFMNLFDEKEVLGKTDKDLYNKEIADLTFADDLDVIQNANPIINKIEIFNFHDGLKRIISNTKIPLRSESGEIIGLVGVSRDITKEKQAEQKIIQLSKGIEQSPASILITDINGNIEYANQKVAETTGFSVEEIKGKSPRIFQSGYTSKNEYARLWKTITSGSEYHGEMQNRKKNGEIYWESVLISPIRNEDGKIVNYIAIKEDITNRKKTDLEILKLSVGIEQNPASVVITDTRGIIEYVNKKFVSITGYSPGELIGKVIRILKPGHIEEETYIEIWNNLFAGNEWRGEHQNRNKNREKYWESVLISPIRNQEGKITNYIVLSEDISERKKMEQELIKAKEKAEESDRLKSAFLANMSHEIRTPLNSILGFSDLLSDQSLDMVSRIEYANMINSSGSNLLAIINDVLDISKIEAGQITLIQSEFSANRLITEIQKEYSFKAVSKGIEFKLSIPLSGSDIKLISDEIRIKQVLINFVGNALKFTQTGFIEIGVEKVNGQIQFHVKDTGIGIAKEYHDKIFDRFRQVEGSQTRKYGGNGLGLAITKNLAALLGGNIWIESEPGIGSTFYFSLPEYDEERFISRIN